MTRSFPQEQGSRATGTPLARAHRGCRFLPGGAAKIVLAVFVLAASPLPRVVTAVLTLTAGASAHILAASPDSDSLTVGATIRPYARIESLSTRKTLRITATDIDRGWVDVPATTHVKIRTNAPHGYHLVVEIDSDAIWLTEVRGLPDHPAFGPKGGRILRTTSGFTRDRLVLGFRFHLAETVQPGTIPWPVRFSVRCR